MMMTLMTTLFQTIKRERKNGLWGFEYLENSEMSDTHRIYRLAESKIKVRLTAAAAAEAIEVETVN